MTRKTELLYNSSEMKKERKPRLKALIEKRDKSLAGLSAGKHILRGTIVEKGNICGNPNCKCKRKDNPELHGPYKYLSHRGIKKTQMIFLNEKKLKHARGGIKEYQKLIEGIYRISEMNFKILRYHYKEIK